MKRAVARNAIDNFGLIIDVHFMAGLWRRAETNGDDSTVTVIAET
jgi:hypothetical protein